jgi:predicted nucleic acid-binding OB-fold protein
VKEYILERRGREKISKVLGKIKYADLTENAKNRLPRICKEIVRNDIEKFNSLLNDQLFPLHKISPKEKRPVNLRANSALFEKLVSRILEELSGSIPKISG